MQFICKISESMADLNWEEIIKDQNVNFSNPHYGGMYGELNPDFKEGSNHISLIRTCTMKPENLCIHWRWMEYRKDKNELCCTGEPVPGEPGDTLRRYFQINSDKLRFIPRLLTDEDDHVVRFITVDVFC